MSDHWIKIIPRDPPHVPNAEAQSQAERLMAKITPAAEQVNSGVSERLVFHDCGANLIRIFCPRCQGDVSKPWWQGQMECLDWDHGVSLLPVKLPCGHTAASLNEIGYDWDQGFSKYFLEAMNPGIGGCGIGEITKAQQRQFEEVLGCEVKVIYRHL